MIIALFLLLGFALAITLFVHQPSFGKTPSGASLERIKKSAHFRNGKFQNIHTTPDLTEGVSYYKVLKEFLLDKSSRSEPKGQLPSQKAELTHLSVDQNVLVWFGHSSYFFQVDGKKFLVDPVFSGAASPVKFTTPSYPGADVYTVDDLPEIDCLLISHDHWDHLDYETVSKLRKKVKKVITGLGVTEHLRQWGFAENSLEEKDWNEEVLLGEGFVVKTAPARHFSGRGFKRMQSIWSSFILKTPTMKLFIGGDSGYDSHFKEIGDAQGPFDLVILECGQYHKNWKYIHMMPEEVIEAAKDLKAKRLMPVHWAKFTLGQHAWDEPIIRLLAANKDVNLPILTPMIGEKVNLKDPGTSSRWWEGL